jgi:hypothetical protein
MTSQPNVLYGDVVVSSTEARHYLVTNKILTSNRLSQHVLPLHLLQLNDISDKKCVCTHECIVIIIYFVYRIYYT